jgi:hypothetical protein
MLICSVVVLGLNQMSIAERSLLGEPYAGISFGSKVIELDRTWSLQSRHARANLEARIVANCAHEICVSFDGFVNADGARIRKEDMAVTINGISVSERPVLVASSGKSTPAGGIDLPIGMGFSVRNLMDYPAGKYVGVVAFRVMAVP